MTRLVAVVAALLAAAPGCKKAERKRPAASSRPRDATASRARPRTSEAWALVSQLPLESDLVLHASVGQLKKSFPGLLTLLAADPRTRLLQERCGIPIENMPRELAASAAFDGRSGALLLTGPRLPANRWLGCARKLLASSGISVQPKGPGSLTFSRGSLQGVARTRGPHTVLVAWGKPAEAVARGASFETLGQTKAIRRLVAAVDRKVFWLVALGLPPHATDRLPNVNAVQQIRALGLGLDASPKGIGATVVLDMRSSSAAGQLAGALRRFLPGLDKFSPDLAPLKPLFAKLRTQTEGNLLKLDIELTWQEVGTLQRLVPARILPQRP